MLPLLLALAGSSPIADSAQPLTLEWSAAPGCPGELELRSQLARLLVTEAASPVEAQGRMYADAGGYALELELRRGPVRDHYLLHDSSCGELSWLAAQLLANLIDPFALARAPEPLAHAEYAERAWAEQPSPVPVQQPRAPEPEREPEPEPEPEPELLRYDRAPSPAPLEPHLAPPPKPERDTSPPASQPKTRPDLAGMVDLDVGGLIGVMPNVVSALRFDLALELDHARLSLAGLGFIGGEFLSASDPNIGADLRGWALGLAGCGIPGIGRVDFPLCARLGGGQLRATGFGVEDARDERQAWLWMSGEPGVEWWLHPRFALGASLSAGVSLVRPAFEVGSSDARFEVPLLFGAFSLGVSARFAGPRQLRSRRERNRNTPRTQLAAVDRNGPP